MILVTGFEPFAGASVNPSAEVAKALDGRRVDAWQVRAAILPVHHRTAAAAAGALLEDLDPAAVVHLGLAAERAQIALERIAINVMDYAIPDNQGFQAVDQACVAGGPAAYFSTLPLRPTLDALRAAGIPAYLSATAGTYLCNYVLYTTLHVLAARPQPVRAGFIHLPLLPSMVALTMRGIALRAALQEEGFDVIEAFPGAAQDVLGLPRKQTSKESLAVGLRCLGIHPLTTLDGDMLDAVTAACVGHCYLSGSYEAIGSNTDVQLINPRLEVS